jgi:hypothetical protein
MKTSVQCLTTLYLLTLFVALTWVPWDRETGMNIWKFAGYYFLIPGPRFPAAMNLFAPVRIAWPRLAAEIGALTALFLALLTIIRVFFALASASAISQRGR